MANKLRRVWDKSSVDVPHLCERERYCPIYEKKGITVATRSRRLEGHELKRAPEQRPPQVVGGTPHGFGVWTMGSFIASTSGQSVR